MIPDPITPAADLSPEEVAAMFNNEFSDMKSQVRERVAFLPRITLTGPKTTYKKEKGVEIGDWLLTPGDTPQDETPKYENLGKSFECTVLHDAMQLVVRDDVDNRTMMESTEFRSNRDPIFLFDSRNGPMHLVAVAPYAGNAVQTIKALRTTELVPQKLTKDGTAKVSALGFDYNVYVMLPDGRIAVVRNTKRGNFGTNPETGETGEFGAVLPDSFIRASATCHEATPGLTLAHRWRISSTEVGGGSDEPRPAFHILGIQDPAKVKDIRAAAEKLQRYLVQRWADRIGYAWSNTSPSQRERLVTAYTEVRGLLDTIGGSEAAAMITLGKKPAPALLAEPEPEPKDYTEDQAKLQADAAKKVDELKRELEDEAALPKDIIDVNATHTPSVKVEDLPF